MILTSCQFTATFFFAVFPLSAVSQQKVWDTIPPFSSFSLVLVICSSLSFPLQPSLHLYPRFSYSTSFSSFFSVPFFPVCILLFFFFLPLLFVLLLNLVFLPGHYFLTSFHSSPSCKKLLYLLLLLSLSFPLPNLFPLSPYSFTPSPCHSYTSFHAFFTSNPEIRSKTPGGRTRQCRGG
jgi:hypothetical protein